MYIYIYNEIPPSILIFSAKVKRKIAEHCTAGPGNSDALADPPCRTTRAFGGTKDPRPSPARTFLELRLS